MITGSNAVVDLVRQGRRLETEPADDDLFTSRDGAMRRRVAQPAIDWGIPKPPPVEKVRPAKPPRVAKPRAWWKLGVLAVGVGVGVAIATIGFSSDAELPAAAPVAVASSAPVTAPAVTAPLAVAAAPVVEPTAPAATTPAAPAAAAPVVESAPVTASPSLAASTSGADPSSKDPFPLTLGGDRPSTPEESPTPVVDQPAPRVVTVKPAAKAKRYVRAKPRVAKAKHVATATATTDRSSSAVKTKLATTDTRPAKAAATKAPVAKPTGRVSQASDNENPL